MEATSLVIIILLIAAAIFATAGFVNKKNKKKVSGSNQLMFAGLMFGIAIIAFAAAGGSMGALTMGDNSNPFDTDNSGEDPEDDVINRVDKLYDSVTIATKTYGSNSYSTAAGTVKFYGANDNPTDSNTNPIDTVTVSSGTGNTSNKVLSSGSQYKIVWDGSTSYYDMYYNPIAPYLSYLPYVDTTSATISSAMLRFEDIVAIASIPDPIDESGTSGNVNGQTTAVNASTGTNEVNVGTAASCANGGILYYDESVGDGQFYIILELGATGANTGLKNAVLCFEDDRSNPFDGTEFSSVECQYQSGTDFAIPQDITTYVNNNVPIQLNNGEFIKGGQTGSYKLTFTLDESLTDAAGDILYIQQDDLGSYMGKDIMNGVKATAGAVVTIAIQA